MTEPSPVYVVAADGGNSKTDLVLADPSGRVLAQVRGPGTHSHLVGVEQVVAELIELLTAARIIAGIPADAPAAAGTFYLANVDLPGDAEAVLAALRSARVARLLEVDNDVLAVLEAGSNRGWGIGVVCGAGMNALGIGPDGRIERFLGLGDVTGDWGGGHGIGVAALGAAVRAEDGRGRRSALTGLIAHHFHRRTASEVAVAAHTGLIDQAELGGLAPVVFQAALDGDLLSRELVHRLADEAILLARTLSTRLELDETATEVVLGGGLLQSGNPVLLDRVAEGITAVLPKAEIVVLTVPPVAGALRDALRRIGATSVVQNRARLAFGAESARDDQRDQASVRRPG
ncbi:hypothetical protein M6D93_03455 [Jatrophihabitans telluris]|uniref:ATPase BadF/BadG/BcrA/BcrD type domain-containing protein n=1 Tax=Jatrophihabitans telluris TaxID=2038343 RepID=A0ABY4R027_9ACTN|nr:BadF/BadG/BcrA/BcrD ATPase family protein [Jatrophihabitans telluris]UQX89065.1 hypothetical protein M6D93_03455 [Jatrophihabitans telluris]